MLQYTVHSTVYCSMNNIDDMQVIVQSLQRKFSVHHLCVTLWLWCTRVVCTITPAHSRSKSDYQPSPLYQDSSCSSYLVLWVSVYGHLHLIAWETVFVLWRSLSNLHSAFTFTSLITELCARATRQHVQRANVIIIIIIITASVNVLCDTLRDHNVNAINMPCW